ncbi:MAG: helix-turn-helix domain-containing protein, partial [Terrimonas sp.]|nr:helix-turn-helix domain-containing protein [Terrimonas sp.]
DYCEKYNLETNMQANIAEAKKERITAKDTSAKVDTKSVSLDLYKQGKSITAIAEERKLTPQTIEGHLSHFIESGVLSVNEFLSEEKQQKILNIYNQNKEAGLTQMKEQLPDINYGELRMMMAAVKNKQM